MFATGNQQIIHFFKYLSSIIILLIVPTISSGNVFLSYYYRMVFLE